MSRNFIFISSNGNLRSLSIEVYLAGSIDTILRKTVHSSRSQKANISARPSALNMQNLMQPDLRLSEWMFLEQSKNYEVEMLNILAPPDSLLLSQGKVLNNCSFSSVVRRRILPLNNRAPHFRDSCEFIYSAWRGKSEGKGRLWLKFPLSSLSPKVLRSHP